MAEKTKNFKRRIAVTGGAGFIGSNLLLMMVPRYIDYLFVNIDCLTYAANLSNLSEIDSAENYEFEKIDITDYAGLEKCFAKYNFDAVIHLAAESHVDRSLIGPALFIQTNVMGTFNLLELARKSAESNSGFRFHHVSTDEVYGSIETGSIADENYPACPSSPYAASKAAADQMVRSYHKSYGLDTVITNCTNNYGAFQFPEKLIPLLINNIINCKTMPVYGDGRNIRDWLYVEDHCRALDLVFHNGVAGSVYNIGSGSETENIILIKKICAILEKKTGAGPFDKLIEFVKDRPGHDRRYALDSSRINNELGWEPSLSLDEGLELTVDWYLSQSDWLKKCTSGEYVNYYEKVYGDRK